jgi:hypothetical protein
MRKVRHDTPERVHRKPRPVRSVVAGTAVLKSEHYEQREFVSWFRKTYPDVRIFAIPNGGWRSRITAAKLKAEGASPGVPDLFIPAWLVWVEMKRSKGGMLSDKQKDWRQYLLSIGHTFILANGKEQAIEAIKEQAWTRTKP